MSPRCRPTAVLMAALAILALTAPLGAGPAVAADSAASDSLTLPYDIPLNSQSSISKYNESGDVQTGVSAPQMTLTIGDSRDDVGLGMTVDPLKGSIRNEFVRVEHHESMDRTVTIPISARYWKPYPREGMESLNGNFSAEMEPVTHNGEKFTLLTVTFEGEGSAVFSIPEDAVATYNALENTQERTNTTFGIDLGLTPTPWERVPPTVFTGNETTVRLEGDTEKMMIQYNRGTADDPAWVPVQSDPDSGPVYKMEKEGVHDAVYVVSRTTDPPTVRYKTTGGIGDRVSGYITGARELPKRIGDRIGMDIPEINLPFTAHTAPSEVFA